MTGARRIDARLTTDRSDVTRMSRRAATATLTLPVDGRGSTADVRLNLQADGGFWVAVYGPTFDERYGVMLTGNLAAGTIGKRPPWTSPHLSAPRIGRRRYTASSRNDYGAVDFDRIGPDGRIWHDTAVIGVRRKDADVIARQLEDAYAAGYVDGIADMMGRGQARDPWCARFPRIGEEVGDTAD